VRDVQLMYDTPDRTALTTLLRKYHVEYVYIGPLERAYYSEPGLRKFRDLVGTAFDLVYVDPAPADGVVDFTRGVQIYRVKPSVLGNQPSALSCQASASGRQVAATGCQPTDGGCLVPDDGCSSRAVEGAGLAANSVTTPDQRGLQVAGS
jgi:hypothetical protein